MEQDSRLVLKGCILVFLGAVCWSLNAPLIKYIQLDSLLVCGMRSLIAAISLTIFIRPKQLIFNKWTLLYLLSYAGLSSSIIFAIKMVSATIAVGMQYSGMIWLFVIAVITKKKALTIKTVAPVALVFSGVICFMLSGLGSGSENSVLGMIIVVIVGICFAGINGAGKKACVQNPLGMTSLANYFTAAFVFICCEPKLSDMLTIDSQSWIILIILGVFQMGAGYAFYNIGLKYVEPQKASIIAPWEMILGPLWVALFLYEYPGTLEVIGFIIILAGMFLDALLDPNMKFGKSEDKKKMEVVDEDEEKRSAEYVEAINTGKNQ